MKENRREIVDQLVSQLVIQLVKFIDIIDKEINIMIK